MGTQPTWEEMYWKLNDKYKSRIAELEAERDKLKSWKNEALAVEAGWDCQSVGKLLGVEWGASIRSKIQPGIEALKAENKHLAAEMERYKWQYVYCHRDMTSLLEAERAEVEAIKSENKRLQVANAEFDTKNAELLKEIARLNSLLSSGPQGTDGA